MTRHDSGIRSIDIMFFVTAWLVVVVASIINAGILPALLFLVLSSILVARNAVAGLILCLLLIYAPSATLGLPNMFAIVAGMVALRLMVDIGLGRAKVRLERILLWVALFCCWVSVSLIRSPAIDLALPYYIRYMEGAVLLVLAVLAIRSSRDISLLLKGWAILAGLATLATTLHVLWGNDTSLYMLMQQVFSRNLIGVDGRINIVIGGVSFRRLLLPGQEPNYTSAGLLFPFGVSLAYIAASSGRARILWIAVAGSIVAGIIGTYSRSGFIAASLIIALFLFRTSPKRGLVPAVVLAVAIAVVVLSVPQLERRVLGINDAVAGGAAGRFTLWALALQMWAESPLLGQGLAAFYAKVKTASHSSYLQVLAETGIIGLGLFLAIIGASLKSGLRVYRHARGAGGDAEATFYWMLLAGLAGFSVMIGTITYQDVKLFWLACGVVTLAKVHFNAARSERAQRAPFPWVPGEVTTRANPR